MYRSLRDFAATDLSGNPNQNADIDPFSAHQRGERLIEHRSIKIIKYPVVNCQKRTNRPDCNDPNLHASTYAGFRSPALYRQRIPENVSIPNAPAGQKCGTIEACLNRLFIDIIGLYMQLLHTIINTSMINFRSEFHERT